MNACDQSADEFFLSLTGFDEIAIAKAFTADISDLREKPFTFLRALVFVHQRREGTSAPQPGVNDRSGRRGLGDRDAYEAAQNLTITELGEYFVDSDGELVEDLDTGEPVSDAGKGSPPSN